MVIVIHNSRTDFVELDQITEYFKGIGWQFNLFNGKCLSYDYYFSYPPFRKQAIARAQNSACPNKFTIPKTDAYPLPPALFALSVLPASV